MLEIETTMVSMRLHRSGVVLVVENKPEVRHTAETMKADVDAFKQLTDGQVLPVVWDIRKMGRPTPEGWLAFMEQIPDVLAALALVVDAGTRNLAGAFPLAMSSFHFPSRVFDDMASAYEWV